MPKITYPNQHIDIEIPHGLRDHVIVPVAVKIKFNLDTESGKALVKKSVNAWFKRY